MGEVGEVAAREAKAEGGGEVAAEAGESPSPSSSASLCERSKCRSAPRAAPAPATMSREGGRSRTDFGEVRLDSSSQLGPHGKRQRRSGPPNDLPNDRASAAGFRGGAGSSLSPGARVWNQRLKMQMVPWLLVDILVTPRYPEADLAERSIDYKR